MFHQGDGVGVFRQAVEAGAVFRGEGFEFVEHADLLEGFGVELDGGGGAEHAGAAAGIFFGVLRVRRGVGAEEEFVRLRTGYGFEQGLAVAFAFEHGQAVVVRVHAAHQEVVAVEQQVLRGNAGGEVVAALAHEAGGFGGGDVLEHGFEAGHFIQHGQEDAFDECGFAVEDVDGGVGYFAVHQEAHILGGDFFEHGQEFEQIGHAAVGVGGGAGGVEFEGNDAGGFGFPHQGGGGVVGEIERHQRLEAAAGGQGGEDAFAVGQGIGHANHRGLEVWHDYGAAHLAGGVWQNVAQGVAVAQVQVHVVGAEEGEGLHGGRLS